MIITQNVLEYEIFKINAKLGDLNLELKILKPAVERLGFSSTIYVRELIRCLENLNEPEQITDFYCDCKGINDPTSKIEALLNISNAINGVKPFELYHPVALTNSVLRVKYAVDHISEENKMPIIPEENMPQLVALLGVNMCNDNRVIGERR